jgi:hypothetical protein
VRQHDIGGGWRWKKHVTWALESERAQERGEEVRWWPGVLGVLFRELG